MKYTSIFILLSIIFISACSDKKTEEEQKLTEEVKNKEIDWIKVAINASPNCFLC